MTYNIDKSSIDIIEIFDDSVVYSVKYRVCDIKIGWVSWRDLKCLGSDVVAIVSCRLYGRSVEDSVKDFVYCSKVALERILGNRKRQDKFGIGLYTLKVWKSVTEAYLSNFESRYEFDFLREDDVPDYNS